MASMFSNVFSPTDAQPVGEPVPTPTPYDNPDSPDDRTVTDDGSDGTQDTGSGAFPGEQPADLDAQGGGDQFDAM